jgi:hypothetical protein
MLDRTFKWRSLISASIVFFSGSLLHFVWEWSGQNMVVAIFAATNESTWEHLKLAFWPAFALIPFQRMIYGACPGWLPAMAIRCVLPSGIIILLFYGYIAVMGNHHLLADITLFAVAILAGEGVGHVMLTHHFSAKTRIGSALALVVATILFATLTFRPPHIFLFDEPVHSQSSAVSSALAGLANRDSLV